MTEKESAEWDRNGFGGRLSTAVKAQTSTPDVHCLLSARSDSSCMCEHHAPCVSCYGVAPAARRWRPIILRVRI